MLLLCGQWKQDDKGKMKYLRVGYQHRYKTHLHATVGASVSRCLVDFLQLLPSCVRAESIVRWFKDGAGIKPDKNEVCGLPDDTSDHLRGKL